MPTHRVEHEQFLWEGDEVVHVPTGYRFMVGLEGPSFRPSGLIDDWAEDEIRTAAKEHLRRKLRGEDDAA